MKSREQKRIEGEERNAEWRTMMPQAQLASLAGRRGHSAKQVKRLAAKETKRG